MEYADMHHDWNTSDPSTMKCPDCGGAVSVRAATCPHCGAPLGTMGATKSLSAIECYFEAFRRYAQFSGRATRSEYWFFVLFNFLVGILCNIADAMLGTGGLVNGIYTLAVLVPGLAVCIRRLHDTNRSGWWWLICLIPLVGAIWLLVLLCLPSDKGRNRFD